MFKEFCILDGEEVGEKMKAGDVVSIRYEAYLSNGKKLDSSSRYATNLTFRLGEQWVIPGLESGIRQMHRGQTALFRVDPISAFGTEGIDNLVPALETVTFKVQLL